MRILWPYSVLFIFVDIFMVKCHLLRFVLTGYVRISGFGVFGSFIRTKLFNFFLELQHLHLFFYR